jgi:hypothetical protein
MWRTDKKLMKGKWRRAKFFSLGRLVAGGKSLIGRVVGARFSGAEWVRQVERRWTGRGYAERSAREDFRGVA